MTTESHCNDEIFAKLFLFLLLSSLAHSATSLLVLPISVRTNSILFVPQMIDVMLFFTENERHANRRLSYSKVVRIEGETR